MGRRTAEERRKEMSVLIRGMEMPKPKLTDPATVYYAYILVRANGHAVIVVDNEDGLDSTDSTEYPLVHVPPHGRLIDADELMLRVNMHGTNKFGMLDDDIREFINAAPTIIEAEEGET
jgi:CBS domain-containing protein